MENPEYEYRVAQLKYYISLLDEEGAELSEWWAQVQMGNVIDVPALPPIPHAEYNAEQFRIILLQLAEGTQDRLIKRKRKRCNPHVDHPSVKKLRSMLTSHGLVVEDKTLVASQSKTVHNRDDITDCLRKFWIRHGWNTEGRVSFNGRTHSLGSTFVSLPKKRNLLRPYLQYVLQTKIKTQRRNGTVELIIDDHGMKITSQVPDESSSEVVAPPGLGRPPMGKGYGKGSLYLFKRYTIADGEFTDDSDSE